MTSETIIDSEQTIHGQTNSNVRVITGGRLVQRGQLNGDVTVESGGSLDQHGQLNGDIHAHGSVRLWGQVNGSVRAYDGSDVLIAEGVMVDGRYLAPDGTFQPMPRGEAFATSVGSTTWRLAPDGQLSRA